MLPNQAIVTQVLRQTRDKFVFGSSNKRYPVPKDASQSKKLAAIRERSPYKLTEHADRLAALPYVFDPKARDKVALARLNTAPGGMAKGFMEAYDNTPAGNCYDMASFAIGLFGRMGIVPVERIDLVAGDHSFVGVGRFNSIDGVATDVQNFGAWGATAFVCDPWTNIACPASEYPQRWNEKMEKWKLAGKEVGYWEPSDQTYHWISPEKEKDSPIKNRKQASDRLVGADLLTLYLYANGLALEIDSGGALTRTDTRHRGEPEAYTGNVFHAYSSQFICPHFASGKTCKRVIWSLPQGVSPLPSLKVGNPYTVAARYIKNTVYPGDKGDVPGGLDGPLHARNFEAWLDATLAKPRGSWLDRLLDRLL